MVRENLYTEAIEIQEEGEPKVEVFKNIGDGADVEISSFIEEGKKNKVTSVLALSSILGIVSSEVISMAKNIIVAEVLQIAPRTPDYTAALIDLDNVSAGMLIASLILGGAALRSYAKSLEKNSAITEK